MTETKATMNYAQFKFLDSNRKVQKGHVNKLIAAIKSSGYCEHLPVLVDKHFNILDGQHRFHACKILGLPILYRVLDGSHDSDLLVTLNTTARVWGLPDYVHHYSTLGYTAYTNLARLMHNTHLSTGVLLTLYTAMYDQSIKEYTEQIFKRGLLDLDEEQAGRLLLTVHKIQQIMGYAGLPLQRCYLNAFRSFLCIPTFDLDRMLSKMQNFRNKAYPVTTTEAARAMLLGVYNFHEKGKKKLDVR